MVLPLKGTLYTHSPQLDQITEQEYRTIETNWNIWPRPSGNDLFSQISNPIIDNDPERLLFKLIDHPYADQICVHNFQKWKKQYVRRASPREIQLLAQNVPHPASYHGVILEIKFKLDPNGLDEERAKIAFCQRNGRFIGYRMEIPQPFQDLFTTNVSGQYHVNFGLWVPPE